MQPIPLPSPVSSIYLFLFNILHCDFKKYKIKSILEPNSSKRNKTISLWVLQSYVYAVILLA